MINIFCDKCGKLVDKIERIDNIESLHTVYTVYCHSETEKISLSQKNIIEIPYNTMLVAFKDYRDSATGR